MSHTEMLPSGEGDARNRPSAEKTSSSLAVPLIPVSSNGSFSWKSIKIHYRHLTFRVDRQDRAGYREQNFQLIIFSGQVMYSRRG